MPLRRNDLRQFISGCEHQPAATDTTSLPRRGNDTRLCGFNVGNIHGRKNFQAGLAGPLQERGGHVARVDGQVIEAEKRRRSRDVETLLQRCSRKNDRFQTGRYTSPRFKSQGSAVELVSGKEERAATF